MPSKVELKKQVDELTQKLKETLAESYIDHTLDKLSGQYHLPKPKWIQFPGLPSHYDKGTKTIHMRTELLDKYDKSDKEPLYQVLRHEFCHYRQDYEGREPSEKECKAFAGERSNPGNPSIVRDPQGLWNAMPIWERIKVAKRAGLEDKSGHWLTLTKEEQSAIHAEMQVSYPTKVNPGNPTCAPCGKATLELYQAADALHYVVSRPKVYLISEESHEGAIRHVEQIKDRIRDMKAHCGLDVDKLRADADRLGAIVRVMRWEDAKKILTDITADLDMVLTPPFEGGKG